MIEKLKKQTKKAIINNLDKLVKKYGFREVRVVINNYFSDVIKKSQLEKEVIEKEKELLNLKRKLGK